MLLIIFHLNWIKRPLKVFVSKILYKQCRYKTTTCNTHTNTHVSEPTVVLAAFTLICPVFCWLWVNTADKCISKYIYLDFLSLFLNLGSYVLSDLNICLSLNHWAENRLNVLLSSLGLNPAKNDKSDTRTFAKSLQRTSVELNVSKPTLASCMAAAGCLQDRIFKSESHLETAAEQLENLQRDFVYLEKLETFLEQ